MNCIGATVIHKTYGKGIITEVSNDYIKVAFVSLPSETKKFPFPKCFDGFLRFSNDLLNLQVQDEVNSWKELENVRERNEKEDQRKGAMDNNQLCQLSHPSRSRRSDNKYSSVRNDRIRGNNLKGLETAKTISIEDNYYFDRIVDVMNYVFHKNYEACMRGFYYLDDAKTIGAWFPKMAVIENGIEVAQSVTKAWINSMSEDGKIIRMYTRDPSLRSISYHPEPHITFARFPGQPYKYVGTFQRDVSISTPQDVHFDRIATSFNLSDWI